MLPGIAWPLQGEVYPVARWPGLAYRLRFGGFCNMGGTGKA